MTVFSGFFNSNNNHDRMYNAQHFSRFFDGLICDGIYLNYPDTETDPTNKAFYVKPAETGLAVTVAQGRAWFDGTWIWNDSALTINLDATSNELMQRIDAIVLDIDTSDQGRQNQILVVKGTEDTKEHTVYRPTLLNQPTHKQFPVAFVKLIGGAATISATNITYVVGTNDPDASPVVEALLELSSYHLDLIDQRFDEDENPVYTEAATLSEPVSGEPALTLYGKIKKLFSTLFAARNHTGNPKFLRHDLSYVEPPVVDTTKPGYCPQRPAGDAAMVDGNYKYLRADGTWTVPPNTQNNNAVAQNSAENANENLKVLLSGKADLVNDTESTKWDSDLLYNPSSNNLSVGSVNNVKLAKSGNNYGYYDANGNFKTFRQPTGNASTGDVLSGKTFANANNDSLTGSMTNNYAVSATINPGGSYTIPAGYHNGSGKVTANPNQNSSTYTFPANDAGGTKDLKVNNTVRYVNAQNVYNYGNSVGYNSGYSDGNTAGYNSGRAQGRADLDNKVLYFNNGVHNAPISFDVGVTINMGFENASGTLVNREWSLYLKPNGTVQMASTPPRWLFSYNTVAAAP